MTSGSECATDATLGQLRWEQVGVLLHPANLPPGAVADVGLTALAELGLLEVGAPQQVLAEVVDPVDGVALVGLGFTPWRPAWRSR